MEDASLALPSSRCIAMGQIGTVPAIDLLLVALKLPTDGTRRAPQSTGNIGAGGVAYPKLGDVVAFVLRELMVSIHVASLSCRKLMLGSISTLSFLSHPVALTS